MNFQPIIHLLSHELTHTAAGLLLIWILSKITNDKKILFWAIFVSIFLDVDHLLDYFLTLGFRFDLQSVIEGSYFYISRHTYILFHSWELALVLTVLGWMNKGKKLGIFTLATGLGMFTHLMIDQIWYQASLGSYFLIARFLHNFTNPHSWY